MKRIAICVLVTLPLLFLALFLPMISELFLPHVELQKLQKQQYTDSIYATGKVEEENKTELSYEIPIVPKEVFVSIGDSVKMGQKIATVDINKTKDALFKLLSLSDKLPKEAVAVLAALDLDSDKLAAAIPHEITADSDGTISDLSLSKGVVTYPTEICATISGLGTLRAKLSVPEEYASCLVVTQDVELTVGALADEQYLGKISQIFPTAHETLVGTSQETIVSCYSSIDGANDSLKAGYTISGKIAIGEEQTLSCLSYDAIAQDEDGQEYVYLLQNGRAVRKNIKTGVELEQYVEVIEGVSTDDLVLSNCTQVKQDGQFVLVSGKE